jgi:hypothetical protein
MYERLSNKAEKPDMQGFLAHIGKAGGLFQIIEDYVRTELTEAKSETKLYFDVHDKGWAVSYHDVKKSKKFYICNIVAEKDAFLLVTRLTEENIAKLYENGTPHAKECIDSSPYRHRCWIEYRVIDTENMGEAKTMLQMRMSGK